jgi:hypothetical protein
MAPRVQPARTAVEQTGTKPMALSKPQSKAEVALAEMRKQVEDNSDYVGGNFVKEARDMHLGDAPARSIYGTAGLEEAKALIEDGVPVMPLPFIPKVRAN